jgi:hypothetical protein
VKCVPAKNHNTSRRFSLFFVRAKTLAFDILSFIFGYANL